MPETGGSAGESRSSQRKTCCFERRPFLFFSWCLVLAGRRAASRIGWCGDFHLCFRRERLSEADFARSKRWETTSGWKLTGTFGKNVNGVRCKKVATRAASLCRPASLMLAIAAPRAAVSLLRTLDGRSLRQLWRQLGGGSWELGPQRAQPRRRWPVAVAGGVSTSKPPNPNFNELSHVAVCRRSTTESPPYRNHSPLSTTNLPPPHS